MPGFFKEQIGGQCGWNRVKGGQGVGNVVREISNGVREAL